MKKTFFFLAATLALTACGSKSGESQSGSAADSVAAANTENAEIELGSGQWLAWSSQNLPLPVSKKQLVHDWAIASQEGYLEDEPPYYYKCLDLDQDGNPEVLLLGENKTGGPRAILCYVNGKFGDYAYASDGYNTFSISEPGRGKAVFVDEHDDHMHTDRNFTQSYSILSRGRLESVGTIYLSIMYNEETGEYDDSKDDSEVPEELQQTQVYDFESLKDWLPLELSEDEQSVMQEVSSTDALVFRSLVEGTLYKGKVGKYPVTLLLMEATPSEDIIGSIYAQYWYESNPTSVFRLFAEGENSLAIQDGGKVVVTLTEYAPNSNQSGKLEAVHDTKAKTIKGTFTNSKGQTFETSLSQVKF